MFTLRTLGGIGLIAAGASWLWLTPVFASRGDTSGFLWAITTGLSLLTVLGFCIATWGLFARWGWWEQAALASAAVGIIAVVAYLIAAFSGGEAPFAAVFEAVVHLLMVAIVAALLLVPSLERWVSHQVMG
ncbi:MULTISPECIES: hypothetical protein [Sinomonas]